MYKFDTFCAQCGIPTILSNHGMDEASRLREYDRRLIMAKDHQCDIGNLLNASLLDVWTR